MFIISEVAPKSKEVKSKTGTTISCDITGLGATATVTWTYGDGSALPDDGSYTPTPGSAVGGAQTTTLQVASGSVTEDKAYICQVTSGQYTDSAASDTTVNLDVYGEVQDPMIAYCLYLYRRSALMRSCRSISGNVKIKRH